MMKKFTLMASVVAMLGYNTVNAQQLMPNAPEVSPTMTSVLEGKGGSNNQMALFDVVFTYRLDSILGGNGKAGVAYVNNQLWISNWATDSMFTIDIPALTVNAFTIPGVINNGNNSGVRSFTWDGTNLWASVNSTEAFGIDPVTQTAASSIDFSAVGFSIRSLAYSPTINGGAGGFWVSNFNTDIVETDMNGNVLNTIAAGTHSLAGMYGTAIDYLANPPVAWVHDQTGTAPNTDFIIGIDLTTGSQTGVSHDVLNDISGATNALAGGIFISNFDILPTGAMLALSQATPSNTLLIYDLAHPVGIDESATAFDKSILVYPNPATDFVKVGFNVDPTTFESIQIINAQGAVATEIKTGGSRLETIDISELNSGIYTVKAIGAGKIVTRVITVQ
ncbi:MAG: T9SS type A sorting domain-containing protein [Bacteroidetes bacterium]|nr:T9SS type A sorting domain-containing protein [Bacteroidota bacterium]